MEKKEMVIKILKESGTLTAKQISAFAKRKYDFDITPQGLRALCVASLVRGWRQVLKMAAIKHDIGLIPVHGRI